MLALIIIVIIIAFLGSINSELWTIRRYNELDYTGCTKEDDRILRRAIKAERSRR